MHNTFNDKWVVVAGLFADFDRHTLRNELRARGGKVVQVLDRRVAMVIAGEGAGRKLIEAKHLGLRIVYEDELKTLLGLNNHVPEIKVSV